MTSLEKYLLEKQYSQPVYGENCIVIQYHKNKIENAMIENSIQNALSKIKDALKKANFKGSDQEIYDMIADNGKYNGKYTKYTFDDYTFLLFDNCLNIDINI